MLEHSFYHGYDHGSIDSIWGLDRTIGQHKACPIIVSADLTTIERFKKIAFAIAHSRGGAVSTTVI